MSDAPNPNPLVQLTLARFRGISREPEFIFWILIFPLLLAGALGVAFRSRGPEAILVGVQQGDGAARIADVLNAAEGLEAEVLDPEQARQKLRTGKVSLVVIPGEDVSDAEDSGAKSWTYWQDPTRPESRLARLAVDEVLQRNAGRADVVRVDVREMTEKGSRYIDFLMPGLLGMNLMSTGLWGVAFNIVDKRAKNMLKRLVASPMRRSDFLLAQVLGRLIFLVLEVTVLVGFAHFFFDVPVRGSLVTLGGLCLLGGMAFAGLGLAAAARPRTIEGVSGLVNLIMLPMWLCSGVFFSTARFPDAVQPAIQLLPLTALNDALRAVMLDGASVFAVAGECLVIGIWGVAGFLFALRFFRWS
jgi:ABC-type multidrug transport system permease subunit